MKQVVVDTNAFLRFILNDIPRQRKEVENIFRLAKQEEIVLLIPQIVLFEIEFILDKYYHVLKEERVNKLESLISVSYFKVQNRSVFQKALELFKNNNLSLADCFVFSYTDQENAELFTFDQKLKKL